jgi:tRNA isopentenyl-2-thiomethyl-A-37 hydroxylase MiaE
VALARAFGPAADVEARLVELAAREAEVVASLPIRPRIH